MLEQYVNMFSKDGIKVSDAQVNNDCKHYERIVFVKDLRYALSAATLHEIEDDHYVRFNVYVRNVEHISCQHFEGVGINESDFYTSTMIPNT